MREYLPFPFPIKYQSVNVKTPYSSLGIDANQGNMLDITETAQKNVQLQVRPHRVGTLQVFTKQRSLRWGPFGRWAGHLSSAQSSGQESRMYKQQKRSSVLKPLLSAEVAEQTVLAVWGKLQALELR